MELTFTLTPWCLISQELMKKLMLLVIKVEQSKNIDLFGVELAFSGALLVMKTSSKSIQYLNINLKLSFCAFHVYVSC
jgi:hypothetical protein